MTWAAQQQWCTGRTGMMGISWGGFAALQVAARRPESLDVTIVKDNGAERFPDIDLAVSHRTVETYSWTGNDVTSVRAQSTWTEVFERGEWSARTVTHTDVSCTPSDVLLKAHLEAFEGDEMLRAYEWEETIPRRLV